jgi:hypothetical protein
MMTNSKLSAAKHMHVTSKRRTRPLLVVGMMLFFNAASAGAQRQERRLAAQGQERRLAVKDSGNKVTRDLGQCDICFDNGKKSKGKRNLKQCNGCFTKVCGSLKKMACKDCREKSAFGSSNKLKCWLCFLCSAGNGWGRQGVTMRPEWKNKLQNIVTERNKALTKLVRLFRYKHPFGFKFLGDDEDNATGGYDFELNHKKITHWLDQELPQDLPKSAPTPTIQQKFSPGDVVRVKYDYKEYNIFRGQQVFIHSTMGNRGEMDKYLLSPKNIIFFVIILHAYDISW